MKRVIILFFTFIISCFVQAQNDTAYIYTYGGIQNDVCNQVKPTWDGGYILIGTSNSFGPGNNNIYVIKTDSMGNHKWSGVYGGTLNQEGFSVTPTMDKGFAMLGFSNSFSVNHDYDVYLVKTDSMGKLQWQKTYGGSDWDFGYSIQQLKDSGYIICGLTYSYGVGNGDVYVIRTDKKGDTVWTRTVGGAGYDVGNTVYVFEDSLYVIAGETTSFGTDTDSYFIKINDKGTIETAKTYGITKNDAMYSIRGTMDKGFLMYGYTDSVPNSNTLQRCELMLKTDSGGNFKWMFLYNNSPGITATGKDAMECPDGNLLTVATYLQSGYPSQMRIQHLKPGGWFLQALDFEGTGDEQGNSIAYRNKYNLGFAGTTTYGAGLLDMYLVIFKSDSLQATYKLSQKYYTDTLGPAGVPLVNTVQAGVKVFPNPMSVSATILVQGEAEQEYKLSLFDETGKSVKSDMSIQKVGHGLSEIIVNREGLSAGIYVYNVMDLKSNKVATGKLIVE